MLNPDYHLWRPPLPRRIPVQFHRPAHPSDIRSDQTIQKPDPPPTRPSPSVPPTRDPAHAARAHPHCRLAGRDERKQDVSFRPRAGYDQAVRHLQYTRDCRPAMWCLWTGCDGHAVREGDISSYESQDWKGAETTTSPSSLLLHACAGIRLYVPDHRSWLLMCSRQWRTRSSSSTCSSRSTSPSTRTITPCSRFSSLTNLSRSRDVSVVFHALPIVPLCVC